VSRGWTIDLAWLFFALGLVALNGFFVAAEFALIKVRPSRLAQLARSGRPLAASAKWLADRLDRSLSACQLGITMASLGLGWVGEPAVAHFLGPLFRISGIGSEAVIHGLSFALSFTIITAAHLVLGEQAPKIFAIRHPEELALWCAAPMRGYYICCYPLLRALDIATAAVLRLAGVRRAAGHEVPHTEEELRDLIGEARAHGELSRSEHRLVEAAFEFDDTICRKIMVPRGETVFLNVRDAVDDLMRIIKKSRHTRYPVCDGSLDKVVGVLHIKDLVGVQPGKELKIRSLMRPPKYVPETMLISRLLGHFRATRQHLAFVVDEHGMVVGIVTLENVLEEIVGPVQDEFDDEQPDIIPDGAGRFLVRGGTPLEDIAARLGIDFEAEGVDTAAGLVLLELGRMPQQGDRASRGQVSMEVLEIRKNRATLIRFSKEAPGDDTA
jgi:CBS domain containing-hemolysin-like protein